MTRQSSRTSTTIEIRPEVTMLSVLRHLNYKPWFAIAEFIDNALQSYQANKSALQEAHDGKFQLLIEVKIDPAGPGRILISDNAAGIPLHDFPRAFRAAQLPLDRSGLSEFGMGMKSAACWFSQKWSVRTKALGEAVERTIEFDIDKIINSKAETLDTQERYVDAIEHYTVVSLHELHHAPQGRTISKIKEHLTSIYRMFLRDESLSLIFNGERLSYRDTPCLVAVPFAAPGIPSKDKNAAAVEWRKEISFDFGNQHRVKGFIGIREMGSTNFAGLSLFRRGRLIEGSYDETYRPSAIFKQTNSYAYQRIFGELEIEGFQVSHTKDGFQWEEYEDVFLQCLKETLENPPLNLLAQAENYRALPSRRNFEAKTEAAANAVAKHLLEEVAPLLADANSNPAAPKEIPETSARTNLQSSERIVKINDGTYLWVIALRTSIDPSREDWLSLAKQEVLDLTNDNIRHLVIDLSLAHPFSLEFLGVEYENVELFLRIAAATSIALVLTEDMSGQSPDAVLHHLNLMMRGALARTSLDLDANPD